ncbi:MAG: hypothetical protein KF687_05615 [Cyclobacteriaceae bacterium]|nr:hypothetical protein [Cyclobacteriaceae bacterium]MBX2961971.1 hypothetical protein [Cyclobacteriaceae bacterium]
MAHDKKHITPENIDEWLASTGFIFPRNELELARFEKLYEESLEEITGKEIDPDKIIKGDLDSAKTVEIKPTINAGDFTEYRMAARNGNDIPKHILDKMKRNQNKKRNDDNGPSEKEDN